MRNRSGAELLKQGKASDIGSAVADDQLGRLWSLWKVRATATRGLMISRTLLRRLIKSGFPGTAAGHDGGL